MFVYRVLIYFVFVSFFFSSAACFLVVICDFSSFFKKSLGFIPVSFLGNDSLLVAGTCGSGTNVEVVSTC